MSNAPEPHEAFLLEEGQEKCTYEIDQKRPNAGRLTVEKEDHTIGNLIRHELFEDPQVFFSGYKIPHPLESRFVLRVETSPDTNPLASIKKSLYKLTADVGMLKHKWAQEVERVRGDQVDVL